LWILDTRPKARAVGSGWTGLAALGPISFWGAGIPGLAPWAMDGRPPTRRGE